jgi:hypothetical protein
MPVFSIGICAFIAVISPEARTVLVAVWHAVLAAYIIGRRVAKAEKMQAE